MRLIVKPKELELLQDSMREGRSFTAQWGDANIQGNVQGMRSSSFATTLGGGIEKFEVDLDIGASVLNKKGPAPVDILKDAVEFFIYFTGQDEVEQYKMKEELNDMIRRMKRCYEV